MNNDTDPYPDTSSIAARIAGLSPEKRALLLKRLSRSALAAEAGKRLGAGEAREATSIAPVPRGRDLPLSFAQQRLWFLDRLLPDKAAYNIPAAWRLQGRLDVPALERSLDALVARHETLRTRFAASEGEPVQVIDPPHAVALPLTDLSALGQAEREAHARQIANAHARQPFDLERGPLLHAQLLRVAAEEHLLLLNVHHIASDGWSVGVFERELSAAYSAFAKGREPELPALPIQYADYAAWQREWLQGEVLESQLSYWKSQLAGVSTLELPTDRPRPPVASHQGAHLAFDLPAPLTGALKTLGRREGATLFMTLLAAFQVLLHRYSGQEDIAVGAPIAGRGRTELEGLIGFFANTLVLRSDLSGNPRFCELLGRVRESALGAYTHQDLPFEKLVEELAPARDLSRNPLFQVMFVLQNAPGATLALKGVEVSRLPLEGHSAKFDLSLSVHESAAGLHASWEYASDLFDAATIERMARHFERLLEAIVADPEQCIGQLPLLTEAERHQLLVEWNDTAADYPRDRCIHQLFEEQTARTPEAVAVVFEDRQLTYAKLNARANQLAHHLIALGVGPEVLVGICAERSLELIVGLLGILKAGGAYVPLDPSYPAKRLEFMLTDTQAPVLLTQQGLLEQLPQFDGRILCLDRDWPEINTLSQANPSPAVTSQSLAYVIYTSGSTGTPKGVAIGHQALVNHMIWMQVRFPLRARDRVLQKTSISFDASVWELFAPFLGGAQLIMAAPGIQRSPADLIETVRRQQITVLQVVPSMLAAMLDELGLSQCTTLHHLYCGGEVLLPEVARRFRAQLSVELINLYGPTEATIDATYCVYLTENSEQTISIGRPIANTRIYILDPHGQSVPVGVTGELYVGGDGVGRGYLNRPELTAEKFLPDPFSGVPGARMYRTEDLARYLPDGNIEFLGRIDDQVKIRGFRIELGEIETVLAEHPVVRQAIVITREDMPGDKRLVAYVVPADASWADVEPLRACLRERLPEYMRPAAYVLLERLPLTPNGKIDRAALPEPGREFYFASAEYIAARNTVEVQLLRIWQDILGVTRIGMRDEFFALGGHSLTAVRVIDEIARIFGRQLPLDTFWYEEGTIEHLAQLLTSKDSSPLWSAAIPFKPSGARRALFCSPVIGGHLFFYDILARHLSPEQPVYGLPARGIDGKVAADTSVEAMAAHCIDTMRQVQSAGPYRLLGYCSGGIIAFEMARQLHARGEQVEFLALLDGNAPGFNLSEFVLTLWDLIRLTNVRLVQQRLYRFVLQNLGLSHLRKFRTVGEAHYWALLSYKGRSYPGEACVFSPTVGLRWRAADLGWGRLVRGGLNIHPISGVHADMITEPGVRTLAALLQRRLNDLATTSV